MGNTIEKFKKLGIDNAPGQEKFQSVYMAVLRGGKLEGPAVDFSHGDVDAFLPIPGVFEAFENGYEEGGKQAYTEYRGRESIRKELAGKLSDFAGVDISPEENIIITPGTQGALFLAMGSMIDVGDKVAIVEPDYFANRKLVEFLNGEIVPVRMEYEKCEDKAGINLMQLDDSVFEGPITVIRLSGISFKAHK